MKIETPTPAKAGFKYLFQRSSGIYFYRRAYPNNIRMFVRKLEFKRSLRTKSLSEAAQNYALADQEYERIAAGAAKGQAPHPLDKTNLAQLKQLSKKQGFDYLSSKDLANASPEEQYARLISWQNQGCPGGLKMAAIFGELADPLTLSDALQIFFDGIKEEFAGLNARERDKKTNPKKQAVNEFNTFLKNSSRDIREITKNDAKRYRSYLQDKVSNGEYLSNTANKKIGHLHQIFNAVIEAKELDIPNPFKGLKLKERTRKRPALTTQHIKTMLLAGGALDGLNKEARLILWAILDTGCSAKELCGLRKPDIHLDSPNPYIHLRSTQERGLKTQFRERKIPLIGYALKAFQALPNGFQAYATPSGADNFSATAMKYLRENELFPSPEYTIYSLRHTFKDRLRLHKIPPELQNKLMGHKDATMGSHYGNGYSLEEKHNYLLNLEKDFN